MKYIKKILFAGFFIISCTAQKHIKLSSTPQLKFIGEYDIAYNANFQNTTIGGLSGIDYDSKNNLYYLICDDRSAVNSARFYKARIFLNEKGIDSVEFISVKILLQPNGLQYPDSKHDPYHTPDPEAMRYNPRRKQLIWTSEGERIIKKDTIVLENPSVNIISADAKYIDSFDLPPNMRMQATQNGPRQNGVFEGLSYINNYKKLLVGVEEPLFEDGARAGLNDSSAWIRIIKYNVKTRKPAAEYAYRIDPVAYPANPPNAFKINGVPDVLAINDHQLFVIERSFSAGRRASTIKIYLADIKKASDVSTISSLKSGTFLPVSKKLVFNMDDLGIYIDNVEGMSFGPKLPNGNQTLVFIADNNFSKEQITQFLLFEIQ